MLFDTNFARTSSDVWSPDCAEFSVALESAIQSLLEGDFQSRWEVAKYIAGFGKSAIAPLVGLLQDEDADWEARWFAARTLGYVEDADALAALIQLLQETQDPELIAIAAEGLSRFGEASIHALVQVFKNPAYRITAIQALASIRHRAALPPLLVAAQDSNPAVRVMALPALGSFRDFRVDSVLIEAVQDPVAAVRKEAIAYLGLRPHLLEKFDLIDLLLPRLWDLDAQVNQATAIALGRLGTEKAVSGLARVLISPHTPESLQVAIVRALSWIQKESALTALFSAWQMASSPLKLEIIEALSRWDSPTLKQQAGAALLSWLETLSMDSRTDQVKSDQVKSAIAFALGCLHYQPARPLLDKLAQDPDEQTSLYAQAALRQLGEAG